MIYILYPEDQIRNQFFLYLFLDKYTGSAARGGAGTFKK